MKSTQIPDKLRKQLSRAGKKGWQAKCQKAVEQQGQGEQVAEQAPPPTEPENVPQRTLEPSSPPTPQPPL